MSYDISGKYTSVREEKILNVVKQLPQNRIEYFQERMKNQINYELDNLEESIEVRFKKYRKARKASKLVFINKPKKIEKNNKIAVIVPYRDNVLQNRKSQLTQFLNYFKSYLLDFNFKIFVIEQSDDNLKFNRGKLLNIGIKLALEQGYDNFITHDVDLLPNMELLPFYTNTFDMPIHIAHSFSKYNYEQYFGGIVSFNRNMINKFNGYPNNFWGWGGEDDSLYNRVTENIGIIGKPTYGKVNDLLHDDTPKDKKNQSKWENILNDLKTWKNNGINNLQYDVISQENFDKISRIKVNINKKWYNKKERQWQI